MQNKVLVNFVHPLYEKSKANKALVSAINDIEGVTFNDLYERYPDFYIDIEREQKLLLEHDVIVFQHPFYWYSSPSLLKEWQDLVLENGFAYGDGGYQLQGKQWLTAITVGGTEDSYGAGGYNQFPIELLLKPFEQTADFCGMKFLAPYVMYEALMLSDTELADAAHQYAQTIRHLRDGDYKS
ncbi:MAG: NAD(P)H-dependent oxidoreductase [Kangiellaceae bacterium]|nr:NAD(P)H-dependent oxidoreductase [Kangiellaceae bacterium]